MRTKPELTELGKFLERQREEKKLGTQAQFADKFSISRTHYINVIQGRSSFSIETCIGCVELLQDTTLSHVLRLNGLGKLATYIEEHYGPPMTAFDVKLLRASRAATALTRTSALEFFQVKAALKGEGHDGATPDRKASGAHTRRGSRKR